MQLPCLSCGRINPSSCNKPGCPYFVQKKRTMKKEFFGASPNIFVGRHGYPDINVGILTTEHYENNDEPKAWSKEETPIPKILDLRGGLINSQFKANVRSFNDRFLESAQLIAQGKNATDMEVSLDRTPNFRINYPPGTSPHGASVKLMQARLTENVKIPRAIDKAVNDPDLKANTAINTLYGDIDEYQLTKLLTGGLLGTTTNKKLVPTRWSITAVDDSISKKQLEKIRELPVINEPTAYFGGHYGNYYCILLFPRKWSYELFEFYTGRADFKNKSWTDYESHAGRKTYAADTAGGYYATRLALTNKLLAMKKQASILVLRFVTDEYTNPLGVWVVREAVKKALTTKPITFSDENLLQKYGGARSHQYNIPYEYITNKSKLLHSFKQKSIIDF